MLPVRFLGRPLKGLEGRVATLRLRLIPVNLVADLGRGARQRMVNLEVGGGCFQIAGLCHR